jgi:hypothetical protein
MARRFSLSIYGDETLKAKFDKVKAYYEDRSPGIPISDSVAGSTMIDEAYQKIAGKETNTNRITTIVERLDHLEEAEKERAVTAEERLLALESAVRELINIVKGEDDDPPYISDD